MEQPTRSVTRWSAVGTLLLAGLLVGPTPSATGAASCASDSDAGRRRVITTNYQRYYMPKQTDVRENFSGSYRRLTFQASKSSTETNKVVGYAEGSASGRVAWAKLEAKVGGSLEDVGTQYSFKGFEERIKLPTGDRYVFSRGVRRYSVIVKWQYCEFGHPSQRGWQTSRSAKAQGNDAVDTVLACKKKTSAGSYSRFLKTIKC